MLHTAGALLSYCLFLIWEFESCLSYQAGAALMELLQINAPEAYAPTLQQPLQREATHWVGT